MGGGCGWCPIFSPCCLFIWNRALRLRLNPLIFLFCMHLQKRMIPQWITMIPLAKRIRWFTVHFAFFYGVLREDIRDGMECILFYVHTKNICARKHYNEALALIYFFIRMKYWEPWWNFTRGYERYRSYRWESRPQLGGGQSRLHTSLTNVCKYNFFIVFFFGGYNIDRKMIVCEAQVFYWITLAFIRLKRGYLLLHLDRSVWSALG